jgi:hypothetical protein
MPDVDKNLSEVLAWAEKNPGYNILVHPDMMVSVPQHLKSKVLMSELVTKGLCYLTLLSAPIAVDATAINMSILEEMFLDQFNPYRMTTFDEG